MSIRRDARVVAIIDMTLNVIGALLLTGLILFLIFKEDVIYNYFNKAYQQHGQILDQADFNAILTIMKWVTGIGCIFVGIQIFAAGCLIVGTRKGIPKNNGLTCCNIWRGVSIFMLVLNYLSIISWFSGISAIQAIIVLETIASLIFRHICYLVVKTYSKELSLEVTSADQPVIGLVAL